MPKADVQFTLGTKDTGKGVTDAYFKRMEAQTKSLTKSQKSAASQTDKYFRDLKASGAKIADGAEFTIITESETIEKATKRSKLLGNALKAITSGQPLMAVGEGMEGIAAGAGGALSGVLALGAAYAGLVVLANKVTASRLPCCRAHPLIASTLETRQSVSSSYARPTYSRGGIRAGAWSVADLLAWFARNISVKLRGFHAAALVIVAAG